MYQDYWHLDRKPFGPGNDPRFYYPSENHQGALLKLRYAVENRCAVALLAGNSGTGKTLLIDQLRRHLPAHCDPLIHVVFPQMPRRELLAYLAGELQSQPEPSAATMVDQSVRRIRDFMVDNAHGGRHAVVVVDEAQLLEDCGTLETMRLLTNLEYDGAPCMTLLLVGQPAILPTLARMPTLDERIGVKALLRPFTLEETASYVNHRLTAAGTSRTIYEEDVVDALHRQTQGIARQINRLCDLTLLVGYAEQADKITAHHVESVAEELVAVVPE
ncbi:MAG: ATPase [Planctomycetes bacterium RBG_16_64_10]|nr:MAG: ATPase [Planctomycetes bacterium RBG_16_64_10]